MDTSAAEHLRRAAEQQLKVRPRQLLQRASVVAEHGPTEHTLLLLQLEHPFFDRAACRD